MPNVPSPAVSVAGLPGHAAVTSSWIDLVAGKGSLQNVIRQQDF